MSLLRRVATFLLVLTWPLCVRGQVTLVNIPGLEGGIIRTHAISGDGTKLFFASAGDPTGGNGDGNVEIFVRDLSNGQTFQVTNTTSQPRFLDNGSVQSNFDGTRITFISRFAVHAGGAELSGRDVFLVDIDWSGAIPQFTFRRVTNTDERGPLTMSGDGSTIILVSDHNITGGNPQRLVQLFRINLNPAINITQLTTVSTGLADYRFRVSVSVTYDGIGVAFHSTRDFSGDNPDGGREVYRIIDSGYPFQHTETPAAVWNSDPLVVSSGAIIFTSNGDLSGDNSDGNREIFVEIVGEDPIQITNTTDGDDGFGGANDDLAVSVDGDRIVFTSNRDLVPASGSQPGNADLNREIFVATFPTDFAGGATFQQITNTTTASPGTRIENVYSDVSTDGTRIAFNSDMDLGVPSTSLLYVATVPEPPDVTPPTIAYFFPVAGGPGVPVEITGDHFAPATAVQFGNLNAHTFSILNDQKIVAIVPQNVMQAPIYVETPYGTASTGSFTPADFVTFGEEFNHGVDTYRGVAGKDALIRAFTGTTSGKWIVHNAQLTVTKPSGTSVSIPPTMYDGFLTNTAQDHSARANVNFYVFGDELDETGTYQFAITMSTLGQQIHSASLTKQLFGTRDVVLVFQSVFRQPDQDEWRTILNAFETFSRLHPIRRGVGDLEGAIGASDFEAGLRVGYLSAPLFARDDGTVPGQIGCPSPGCWSTILSELEDRLAAVNSGGFEATEFATAFMPTNALVTSGGDILDCNDITSLGAHGYGRFPGAATWVQLCAIVGTTLAHEIAHNMGVVASSAANSDGGSHSSNARLDELNAFNMLRRENVEDPRSVMWSISQGPEEIIFFESMFNGEEVDYSLLVDSRSLQVIAGPPPEDGAGESAGEHPLGPAPGLTSYRAETPFTRAFQQTDQRFVLMAHVDASDEMTVRHAYVTDSGGFTTPLDSSSRYALAFLDATGQVLATDRVKPNVLRRHPRQSARAEQHLSWSVIRPLPRNTSAVELRRDGAPLGRLSPGRETPILEVDTPRIVRAFGADRIELRWRATDRDGDPISYHLGFTLGDGAPYQPIVGSTRDTVLGIPLSSLPGGAVRFRVVASDGLHVTSQVTTPVRVSGHNPSVAITSIEDGARFTQRDSIPLRGLAYDMEEGILGDRAADTTRFRWLADSDRLLGTGTNLRILAGRLRPGANRLVLEVRDNSGRRGLDTVLVIVEDSQIVRPPVFTAFPKTVEMAALLSLVVPGLGSMYADHRPHARRHLILTLLTGTGVVVGALEDNTEVLIASASLAGVNAIWAAITAVTDVYAFNARLGPARLSPRIGAQVNDVGRFDSATAGRPTLLEFGRIRF